ncbi:hypothetical protein JCM8097_001281 [Rhodosporidiobolus ruineniae]
MSTCDCGHHSCWEPDDDDLSPELYIPRDQRPVRALPKRQRLAAPPKPAQEHLAASVETVVKGRSARIERDTDSGDDEQPARDSRAQQHKEATAATRAGMGDGGTQDYGGLDARAYEHWLAQQADHLVHSSSSARDPDRTTADSTKTTNSLNNGSSVSQESPPTSPASEDQLAFGEIKEEDGPEHDPLFGDEGRRISQALSSSSSFSPAGLFGGLGLATLHPSLAPPQQQERHYEDEDEHSGDEDTYGAVDRSRPPVEPSFASQEGATALGLGGSNKKKRKIPGLNMAGGGAAEEDLAEGEIKEVASPQPTSEFSTTAPLKAPVNPPTTAKAALAKLRIRPPHISLCADCTTARRHRRKRFRTSLAKQHPLSLPPHPDFVPPAMPRDGPPPLPPGSGLKGSKALKAAMKAHREREKEKERIRKLFAHVRVPDLYDPDGTAGPAPLEVARAIKGDLAKRSLTREGLSTSAGKGDVSSAYPTPPGSSDEGEDGEVERSKGSHWSDGLPTLDLFTYLERPTPVMEARWKALNEQKERLKAAKERAAKAREEEQVRRKEKEEKERAEAAEAAAAAPPAQPQQVAVSPSTPAATPKRGSRLPKPPASTTPAPPPPASSASQPPAPPPAAALPPPPPPLPPSKPKKKGRKKRSAHANAHNVHHRDNYIPSRLAGQSSSSAHHHSSSTPTPGQHPHADGASSPFPSSWPASPEAVAAAGSYAGTCANGHFCGPDEYLCLFCEYEIWYGEEPLLLKAIRKRKGVLGRRKKARDRAEKATQGQQQAAAAAAPAEAPSEPVEGEEEPVAVVEEPQAVEAAA